MLHAIADKTGDIAFDQNGMTACRAQQVHHALRRWKQPDSGGAEPYAAGVAFKQQIAAALFQLCNAAADRRLAEFQLACCSAETAGFGHSQKQP